MRAIPWLAAVLLLPLVVRAQETQPTPVAAPAPSAKNEDAGVDPALVGTWQTMVLTNDGFATVTLRLEVTGAYRRKSEGAKPSDETGTFRAKNGKWSLTAKTGPAPGRTDSGTYQPVTGDAIVLTGPAGPQGYMRVPGSGPPAGAVGPAAAPTTGILDNKTDAPRGALKITWRSLGPRNNMTPSLPLVSPGDWHQMYVVWVGGKAQVALDGVVGKFAYDAVDHLLFNADGKRTAFLAARGDKRLAVVDGTDGPAADEVDSLQFSPDGKRVAYVLKWKQPGTATLAHRAVIDGLAGPVYDKIEGLNFSLDSKHTAYVAHRGTPRNPATLRLVVRDGKEGKQYSEVNSSSLRFSPDSLHLAYAASLDDPERARIEKVQSQNFRIVRDGVETPIIAPDPSDFVDWPVLSPDGRHVAYILEKGGNGPTMVVLDGKPGKAYPAATSISYLTFSPNAQHLAYLVTNPGSSTTIVVVDGKEGPQGGSFDQFQFSADGEHFAYLAQTGPVQQACVTEAGVGKSYLLISDLLMSPDGKHVAYLARRSDGGAAVVRDGKEEKPYFQVLERSLHFSPDGKRLAYRVMTAGGMVVVADGLEGKAYGFNGSVPGLAFSPDGRHLAYVAQRADDGKGVLVVDGVESAPFDEALEAPVVFDGPDRCHVLAGRGGNLIRLETDLGALPASTPGRASGPSGFD